MLVVNTHAAFIYVFYYKNPSKFHTFIIFRDPTHTLILGNVILHIMPMIAPHLWAVFSMKNNNPTTIKHHSSALGVTAILPKIVALLRAINWCTNLTLYFRKYWRKVNISCIIYQFIGFISSDIGALSIILIWKCDN